MTALWYWDAGGDGVKIFRGGGDLLHCRNCGVGFSRGAPAQRHCDECSKWRLWGSRPSRISRIIACGWCGRGFETTNRTQRYCCRRCRRAAKKKREYAKAGRQPRVLVEEDLVWLSCKNDFTARYHGQKYCSAVCQRRERNKRQKKSPAARLKRNLQKRMARLRRAALRHTPLLEPRACIRCQTMYVPKVPHQKYCKPECKDGAHRGRQAVKYREAWKFLQQLKERYDVDV